MYRLGRELPDLDESVQRVAEARDLMKMLDGMRTDRPAVAKKGKNLVFVRPELVAEIEYRGWTDDDKLRHSSFKGLREPDDEAAVFLLSEVIPGEEPT